MKLKHVRFRDPITFPGAPSPGSVIEANTKRVGNVTWDSGFVGVEMVKNDGSRVKFRVPFTNVMVAEEAEEAEEMVGAIEVMESEDGVSAESQEPAKRGGWPKGKPRKKA